LIVALDVATPAEAVRHIKELQGDIGVFKVGQLLWATWMRGGWQELVELLGQNKVFLDLKLGADIPATTGSTVKALGEVDFIKFLTLDTHTTPQSMSAARDAKAAKDRPILLTVPYLSSLDGSDLKASFGADPAKLDAYIEVRSRIAMEAGCDGLIASGTAVAQLRKLFPGAVIVSPGIRPVGFSNDDHKRFLTPKEAIQAGADYIVVGRPILSQPTPDESRRVAREIVAEIEAASQGGKAKSSGHGDAADSYSAQAAYCKDAD
jgi:orotidine-5'-phosphate decarboxylase